MNKKLTENDYIMDESLSVAQVAEIINKSESAVYARRKKLGVKFNREIKLDKEALLVIRNVMLSNDEVAKILQDRGIKISANTVAVKRKKMNILKHATRSDLLKIYSTNGNINKAIEKDLEDSSLSSDTIAKRYNISNFSVMLMRQNKLVSNTYDISIDYNDPESIKQILNIGLTNVDVAINLGAPACAVNKARREMRIRYMGKCYRPENYKYVVDMKNYTVVQCARYTGLSINIIRTARSKIRKDLKKYNMKLLFEKIDEKFINDFSVNNDLLTNNRIEELSKKYGLSLDVTRFLSKKIKKNLSEKEKALIMDLNNLMSFKKISNKYNLGLNELDLFMNKNKDSLNIKNILIADAIYSKEYTAKEIAIMFNCRTSNVNYITRKIGIKTIMGYSKRLLYVKKILEMVSNDINIKTISEKTGITMDEIVKIKRQEFARRLYDLKYKE